MSKRVFISGPISGVEDYKERFAEKAADYLLECLEELVHCDGICFLPGARKSKGSLIEREFAKYAGIPEVKYE